jgi:hypothetical protein
MRLGPGLFPLIVPIGIFLGIPVYPRSQLFLEHSQRTGSRDHGARFAVRERSLYATIATPYIIPQAPQDSGTTLLAIQASLFASFFTNDKAR